METTLKTIINKDWIALLLILSFIVIAVAKFFYGQRFLNLIPFLGSDKYVMTRSKDKGFFNLFTILLSVHQIVLISLFLFLWYTISLGINYSESPDLYIKILIGYAVFEVIRTLIDKIIGYLLNIQGIMNIYLFRKLNFKNFLSILILALCFFIIYSDYTTTRFLYISLGIIIIAYFISLVLTISKHQEQILSLPSYFILYFCTLEIAPYYILYHLTTN
ncbi:DUF4271 domain-containing protein [Dokdonia sp.]|uniref:DUF4271 domain-containing protein n=1 Tax=Dokdonia sp. TaxID=2024995 RepID=UPI00326307B4